MNNFQEYIQKERLISTFMKMVRISSESGKEQHFAKYLLFLASEMGYNNWKDPYMNVYIEIPGKGKPLMLNTHMDTAKPGIGIHPQVRGEYLVSDGTTILGADSKAGIAAMIEMAVICKEHSLQHRPLLLTFTCNEESGIPTAQYISTDVTECIVPDRGSPLGDIIISAPFAQVFEVFVQGKTAYATTSFSTGHHAILSACQIIESLPIGDIDAYTTTNIGVIQGGLMPSMVPESCSFTGSCYSFNEKSFTTFFRNLKNILSIADKKFKTKSTIKPMEYFPGFRVTKNDPLVHTVSQALRRSNLTPTYVTPKAVTNANLLHRLGIKTVVISTGVEHQHTVHERISIRSLEKIVEVLMYCIQI